MIRSDSNNYVTLEIVGGPPGATATVLVGGAFCQRVALNGCGTGSTRVVATSGDPSVEIAIEDRVLLTGHLPPIPEGVGSGT